MALDTRNSHTSGTVPGIELLYIASDDRTNELEVVELSAQEYNVIEGVFWSQDESRFLVQVAECQPDCDIYKQFLFSSDGTLLAALPNELGQITFHGVWSPDGHQFLYNKLYISESGWRYDPTILNLVTMEVTPLGLNIPEGFYISYLAWMPIHQPQE